MRTHERFWALEAETAEIVLRGVELGLSEHRDPDAAASSAAQEQASVRVDTMNGIAVVHIDGALSRTAVTNFWGDVLTTGYDSIRSVLDALVLDASVSGILLDIDSPGGSVSGVQELADVIAGIAARKPCAAFTNGMMASAAFWIGASTGRVYATQTSEVGSIGVIMTLYDQTRANERAGINVHVISSGRLKAAGNPHAELTEEQRIYFQGQADGIHAVFRASVADRMGLDLSEAEAWGDGQVFLGSAALERGLVTKVVSGLDEAVTLLSLEATMNRTSLEAQAPELVAELIAEGRAQAEAASLQDVFLAAARSFLSEEQAAKIDAFIGACTSAKLSREQAQAMLAVSDLKAAVAVPAPEAKADPEAKAQAPAEAPAVASGKAGAAAKILGAIQAQSLQGVPAGADSVTPKTVRDFLLQAAGKIGA